MEVHPRQCRDKEQQDVCHPETAAAFSNPDEKNFPIPSKRECGCCFFFFNKPNRIIPIIISNWMSKSDIILVLSFYVKLMSSDWTPTKPLIFFIFHVLGLLDRATSKLCARHISLSAAPEDNTKGNPCSTTWKGQCFGPLVSARYPLAQDNNCNTALICTGPQRNKSHYLNSDQSEAL